MSHQDWDQVIIRGKNAHVKKKKELNGETETQSRVDRTKISAMGKLDDSSEAQKPLRINPSIKTALMKARTSKKLSQKQVATSANIPLATLQSYEQGKAKAEIGILNKNGRVLGVKLTGKEFGSMNL